MRVDDGVMVADMVGMLVRDIEVYDIVWSDISDPLGKPRPPTVKATRRKGHKRS